ncbi:MAG: cobalamin biosynthesis protein P47K [Oscillospiraceae bacterium]|nr:cobalamin biosynthesis protein P47K [Oscillospiraceae bacterium]
MKILIVGGFLGSGKTSFILQLARHMIDDLGIKNVVIIENEIGEVSVDDKTLMGAGYEVRGLFSGCVCCTLAGALPPAIADIQREIDPDWIIMEASGLAFPSTIRENLEMMLDIPCRVCCLADAQRWRRLYAALEELMRGQLESADVILVNKADLADAAALDGVLAAVREINGAAAVIPLCANGEIPDGLFETVLGKE